MVIVGGDVDDDTVDDGVFDLVNIDGDDATVDDCPVVCGSVVGIKGGTVVDVNVPDRGDTGDDAIWLVLELLVIGLESVIAWLGLERVVIGLEGGVSWLVL